MVTSKFFEKLCQGGYQLRIKLVCDSPAVVYTVIGADKSGIFVKIDGQVRWLNMDNIIYVEPTGTTDFTDFITDAAKE